MEEEHGDNREEDDSNVAEEEVSTDFEAYPISGKNYYGIKN